MRYERIPEEGGSAYSLPFFWRREDGQFCRHGQDFRSPCFEIGTSHEAAQVFRRTLARRATEELWVLGIDEECFAMAVARVSTGTVGMVACDAADVLRAVRTIGVQSFIAVHNHPSGDPRPSMGDWVATRQLWQEAERVGFELVDHLVLGDGVYVSLRGRDEALFWP